MNSTGGMCWRPLINKASKNISPKIPELIRKNLSLSDKTDPYFQITIDNGTPFTRQIHITSGWELSLSDGTKARSHLRNRDLYLMFKSANSIEVCVL